MARWRWVLNESSLTNKLLEKKITESMWISFDYSLYKSLNAIQWWCRLNNNQKKKRSIQVNQNVVFHDDYFVMFSPCLTSSKESIKMHLEEKEDAKLKFFNHQLETRNQVATSTRITSWTNIPSRRTMFIHWLKKTTIIPRSLVCLMSTRVSICVHLSLNKV